MNGWNAADKEVQILDKGGKKKTGEAELFFLSHQKEKKREKKKQLKAKY